MWYCTEQAQQAPKGRSPCSLSLPSAGRRFHLMSVNAWGVNREVCQMALRFTPTHTNATTKAVHLHGGPYPAAQYSTQAGAAPVLRALALTARENGRPHCTAPLRRGCGHGGRHGCGGPGGGRRRPGTAAQAHARGPHHHRASGRGHCRGRGRGRGPRRTLRPRPARVRGRGRVSRPRRCSPRLQRRQQPKRPIAGRRRSRTGLLPMGGPAAALRLRGPGRPPAAAAAARALRW